MLCPYLMISINELLISIISFNDINKYGLNVKTAAHRHQILDWNGQEKNARSCTDLERQGNKQRAEH